MNAAHELLDRSCAIALRLRRAFDARARRERLLLIGAAIAGVWMLGDSLWLGPAFGAWSAARARQASAAAALARLGDDIGRRASQTRIGDQQARGDLVQWRERVAQGDRRLQAVGATLVGAADMVPVLERLLAQVGGLRLRSMRSLPRTEVAGGAATAGAPTIPVGSAGTLYRHGVELTVEGSYGDLLAYLRALEAMPQRALGGGLQIRVERHPTVVMTLRLHTLSRDRSWLEI